MSKKTTITEKKTRVHKTPDEKIKDYKSKIETYNKRILIMENKKAKGEFEADIKKFKNENKDKIDQYIIEQLKNNKGQSTQ
jgi:hypothetical protein